MKKSRFEDKVIIITGASSEMHDARYRMQVRNLNESSKRRWKLERS